MAALIAAALALCIFEEDFASRLEELDFNNTEDENDLLKEIRGPTSSVISIAAVAIVIETVVVFF